MKLRYTIISTIVLMTIIIYKHPQSTPSHKPFCNSTSTLKTSLPTENSSTIDRLQEIFKSNNNSHDTEKEKRNAAHMYQQTAQAIPQIAKTLIRISNIHVQQGHNNDAHIAYTTAQNLNPSSPYKIL